MRTQFLQDASGVEFEALRKISQGRRGCGGGFLTRWSVCFQSGDDPRLSDLVWPTVIHIHSSKKENVALLCDSRGNCFHDLAVDRLFIVSYEVLIQQLLDLVWR